MVKGKQKRDIVDMLYLGILLVVFGGIVLHAPLSVGLSTLFPGSELLIKAWKELLLGVALPLAGVLLLRYRRTGLLKDPLVLLIGLYALLHGVLWLLSPTSLTAAVAGIMIDLRYLLFFVLVFVAIRLYPQQRRVFVGVGVAGAAIVVGFALLQVTVLPHDILKYIGYNQLTIAPFLTVDQNMDYIRINSTLRGPNPLGAYAVIALSGLAAFWASGRYKQFKRLVIFSLFLAISSAVALWASYSRSALIAAVVALAIVGLIALWHRIPKWWWVVLCTVLLAGVGGVYAARDSAFVSHVILHEDPEEAGTVNSNDGHIESLKDGIDRMIRQPLGGGIGSTGSASYYTDEPLIIENQYLFVAHETGWLGLALFLAIYLFVLWRVWVRRKTDWLAVGVLASGLGLGLIGLLLPVWVDDTVAIIWWGLAGIVIGGTHERPLNKKAKRTA